MILTCPKCASRYNLLASILAPEGRRVKCSNCGEIWQQLPDPDELIAEIEMQDAEDAPPPLEDIPDAVKPIPEGSSVPALSDGDQEEQKEPANKAVILLSAFLMFIILSAPIIALKSTIIKKWPESIAFYQTLGMSVDLPGAGIVFDKMRAELNDSNFTLSGQIINLTTTDSILPLIEVTLKDNAGEVINHHYIRMPKDVLSAEETLPITAVYEVIKPEAIHDASIRFVLKPKVKPKTASTSGDNNLAPHADENHPQPAAAKAPKSPEHDDAPPHQE